MNLFRLGARLVIVDFAHNEAGIDALLDVAQGLAAGGAGRAAPITVILGTAGDRPDDTLRGIARIAARRSQRVVVKETIGYLRGRTREHVIGELLAGIEEGGMSPAAVPVYETETAALRAELNGGGAALLVPEGRPEQARVIVLLCHEERDAVLALLDEEGARPVDVAAELTTLVPRFPDRPARD
jgi:cyanophycin synthetase